VTKRVRVVVFLKPGVLDAQGQAVETGLRALGFQAFEVRVGKAFELTVPEEGWRERLRELCDRFLTNPLVEEYEWYELGECPEQGLPNAGSRGLQKSRSDFQGAVAEAEAQ